MQNMTAKSTTENSFMKDEEMNSGLFSSLSYRQLAFEETLSPKF